MKQYIDWLFVKKGLYFRNYEDVWDWSVTNLEHFWESIAQFFDIQFTSPYHVVQQPADDSGIIGTSWFTGATLNYAEHIFRQQTSARPALLFAAEQQPLQELSWSELTRQVSAVSIYLRAQGVRPGDRVVAVLPNGPEAVVAFLATSTIGAVWSVSPPDFTTGGLIDRFQPLAPKVLITVDGYVYNGRAVDRRETVDELRQALPMLTTTILVPSPERAAALPAGITSAATSTTPVDTILWNIVLTTPVTGGLVFEPLPFAHPIWVLYSSGTMGQPKAFVHSVGGCLLEHCKVLVLHQDVQPGERYLWYTPTGGVMWPMMLSTLLVGATPVLYDGAPAYPDLTRLWQLIDRAQVDHFGAGAAYWLTCIRSGMIPLHTLRLSSLRTAGVTDAPLPDEGYRWIHEAVKAGVWIQLLGSTTDIGSVFVGGNPLLPVRAGGSQCRLLGCKIDAVDADGQPVRNQPGELVILKPMPSMPVCFWNDPDNERYRNSYFGRYTDVWRHDDLIEITDRGTVGLSGRTNATLNREGSRIGTADFYNVVAQVTAVVDSLVVGVERPGGLYFMPLFVVLRPGVTLGNDLIRAISQTLLDRYGTVGLPNEIIQVDQLPYTNSGRKPEIPLRKMVAGMDASLVMSRNVLRNPAVLDTFIGLIDALVARW